MYSDQMGKNKPFLKNNTYADRLKGYRDQILFANKSILPIIDTILAKSKGNAIIVLEGDHGIVEYTDGTEHMKNLNAYYFPDHNYSDLYPWITPVNSFRVILSDYFGQNYPLLEDQSYFSETSAEKTFTLDSQSLFWTITCLCLPSCFLPPICYRCSTASARYSSTTDWS